MNNFKEDLKIVFTGLCETYDKVVTPSLFMIYLDSLNGFSISDIKTAVKKHLLDPKHGSFFPKPADIVRNIDGERRSLEDKGNIAWMEIERAIARVGAYGTLEMDDKQALMAIKAMGSWQQLCHTSRDNLAWKKKEFIENYKALEHTPVEMLPHSLLGIEDLANQRKGLDNPADKLLEQLAEREKAK